MRSYVSRTALAFVALLENKYISYKIREDTHVSSGMPHYLITRSSNTFTRIIDDFSRATFIGECAKALNWIMWLLAAIIYFFFFFLVQRSTRLPLKVSSILPTNHKLTKVLAADLWLRLPRQLMPV